MLNQIHDFRREGVRVVRVLRIRSDDVEGFFEHLKHVSTYVVRDMVVDVRERVESAKIVGALFYAPGLASHTQDLLSAAHNWMVAEEVNPIMLSLVALVERNAFVGIQCSEDGSPSSEVNDGLHVLQGIIGDQHRRRFVIRHVQREVALDAERADRRPHRRKARLAVTVSELKHLVLISVHTDRVPAVQSHAAQLYCIRSRPSSQALSRATVKKPKAFVGRPQPYRWKRHVRCRLVAADAKDRESNVI